MNPFALNPEFKENPTLLRFLLRHYEDTSVQLHKQGEEIHALRKALLLIKADGRMKNHFSIQLKSPTEETFPAFNEEDYLQVNPDVKKAVQEGLFTSGWKHFIQFGYQENRLRSLRHFDGKAYFALHQDVHAAYLSKKLLNAETHFLQRGRIESRFFSPLHFDEEQYLDYYPEIKPILESLNLNPLDHFRLIGSITGRLYFVKDHS